MARQQWVYRPSDEEHELLLKAMASSDYPSVAQFVREGVMRLIHDGDRRSLYIEVGELIDDLGATKEKFLSLVLRHSEND